MDRLDISLQEYLTYVYYSFTTVMQAEEKNLDLSLDIRFMNHICTK